MRITRVFICRLFIFALGASMVWGSKDRPNQVIVKVPADHLFNLARKSISGQLTHIVHYSRYLIAVAYITR